MNGTQKAQMIAEAIYTHPEYIETRRVIYGINRNGKHVICQPMILGQDICDTIDRFDTVEEARVRWAEVVRQIKAQGFTVKLQSDDDVIPYHTARLERARAAA